MRWAVGDQWIKNEKENFVRLNWVEAPQSFDVGGPLSGVLEWPVGSHLRVFVFPFQDRWLVRIGEWYLIVRSRPLEKLPASETRPKQKKAPLAALVSGRVHALYFRSGTPIKAHEILVCIESMGVLVPHALPIEGMVASWKVQAEEHVEFGQEIAEIDLISQR